MNREWVERNLNNLTREIKLNDSEEMQKAVRELYYWQYDNGKGTNFHSMLFTLFQKADPSNFKKLERGFPEEAAALRMWYVAENNGDDLFRHYGFMT